eukprot:653957_1
MPDEQDHLSSCTPPESLSPEETEDDLDSQDALADLCLQWAHLLKPTESSMISQKVSAIHDTMSVMSKDLMSFAFLPKLPGQRRVNRLMSTFLCWWTKRES